MRRLTLLRDRKPTRRAPALATVIAVIAGFASMTTADVAGAADTPLPLATDGVWGIDFAGGTLNTVERGASGDEFVVGRQIAADGTTASDPVSIGFAGVFANGTHIKRVPCDAGSCVPLMGAGNGDVGYAMVSEGQERVQIHVDPTGYHGTEPAVTGARIVDMSGRYFVYDAQSTGKQYIDDVPAYRTTDVRITRSVVAASVWGTQLWTAGAAAGAVTAVDLKTRKTVESLSTGSGCVIAELRAVGRWIYWNCGGPTGRAGVFDRTAKKSFAVRSGPALVGDGYLVQHDRTAGKLLLTDFHTGTGTEPRPLADLPAGDTADQRRLTWAVDKFGGDIAYVGPDHGIHIVPSGVPSQPLARTESDVDDDYLDINNKWWNSTWEFSKPVMWTFTVRDAGGRTVRTLTGSGTTEADIGWDGRTNAGAYAYNGAYTWTLTARPAEGTGTYSTSGEIGVTGGRQGYHDQGGYNYGELLTLNSKGALTLHYTEGKGTFNWKRSASGWPAGSVAVPFGDMGADRCAELLMRMPAGELRRYAGRCGEPYKPTNGHTSLGTGWNAYNVLTAPGDITGDGRTDLLARKASTGDLWLFPDDGHGKLAAGRKIGSGWSVYTHVVGAGDLNGDGFGDVLARGKNGSLYRFEGTGKGTLRPRVTMSANWGATYNAIVVAGDLTGDGRNDMIMRDKGGVLYRSNGNGKGSFGARTKIATGWQGYKGLF